MERDKEYPKMNQNAGSSTQRPIYTAVLNRRVYLRPNGEVHPDFWASIVVDRPEGGFPRSTEMSRTIGGYSLVG